MKERAYFVIGVQYELQLFANGINVALERIVRCVGLDFWRGVLKVANGFSDDQLGRSVGRYVDGVLEIDERDLEVEFRSKRLGYFGLIIESVISQEVDAADVLEEFQSVMRLSLRGFKLHSLYGQYDAHA
jgi:hypothetical protein